MSIATPKTFTVLNPPLNKHVHYWTLALIAGAVVGICKCGETLSYREVIALLNRE